MFKLIKRSYLLIKWHQQQRNVNTESEFLVYTVKPVQTTTFTRWPMLSPPKQIPIQLLLYMTTSNNFFCLPNEKKPA